MKCSRRLDLREFGQLLGPRSKSLSAAMGLCTVVVVLFLWAAFAGCSGSAKKGGNGGVAAGGVPSGAGGGAGGGPTGGAIAGSGGAGIGGSPQVSGGATGNGGSGGGGRSTTGGTTDGGTPDAGGIPASGGSPGSGGIAASGGSSGSGGRLDGGFGSGGQTGAGGIVGSGGGPTSGGAPGSGGVPGSGGMTGSGGVPGSGGMTGTGGGSGSAGSVEYRSCEPGSAVTRVGIYRIDRTAGTCVQIVIQQGTGGCTLGLTSGGFCLLRANVSRDVSACEAFTSPTGGVDATSATGTFSVAAGASFVVDLNVDLSFPQSGDLPRSVHAEVSGCSANCKSSDCRN